jgi:membrane associated rhomboid family serine protease
LAKHEPVFNGPRVVLFSIAVLVACHVGRALLDEATDDWLTGAMAFIPVRYSGEPLPGGAAAKVTSFVTHMVLHGDATHLLVNCGWLLAFGTILARRLTAGRFLALSVLAGIAGAAVFLGFNWGVKAAMVGASGAISGMMGAAVRFMFQDAGYRQVQRDNPWARGAGAPWAPCMTLAELLRDQRARLMVGSWVVVNLLFGLFLGEQLTGTGIAWEAHLGGFFAGLLLFPLFDRPPSLR